MRFIKRIEMPIPTKKATETKGDFLIRCMTDDVMSSEYPDITQRYAICIHQSNKPFDTDK